ARSLSVQTSIQAVELNRSFSASRWRSARYSTVVGSGSARKRSKSSEGPNESAGRAAHGEARAEAAKSAASTPRMSPRLIPPRKQMSRRLGERGFADLLGELLAIGQEFCPKIGSRRGQNRNSK